MSDIDRRVIPGSLVPPGVNVTSHPRCGDTDRNRAADRVSEAYARGFIDKDEAEARHEAIGQATLGAHLELVTRDIPVMSRWRGASLPTRTQSRAEQLTKWWNDGCPWTGIAALLGGLLTGITPTVVLGQLHAHVWEAVSAATTIPLGSIVFLVGFCSLMAWSVDV